MENLQRHFISLTHEALSHLARLRNWVVVSLRKEGRQIIHLFLISVAFMPPSIAWFRNTFKVQSEHGVGPAQHAPAQHHCKCATKHYHADTTLKGQHKKFVPTSLCWIQPSWVTLCQPFQAGRGILEGRRQKGGISGQGRADRTVVGEWEAGSGSSTCANPNPIPRQP